MLKEKIYITVALLSFIHISCSDNVVNHNQTKEIIGGMQCYIQNDYTINYNATQNIFFIDSLVMYSIGGWGIFMPGDSIAQNGGRVQICNNYFSFDSLSQFGNFFKYGNAGFYPFQFYTEHYGIQNLPVPGTYSSWGIEGNPNLKIPYFQINYYMPSAIKLKNINYGDTLTYKKITTLEWNLDRNTDSVTLKIIAFTDYNPFANATTLFFNKIYNSGIMNIDNLLVKGIFEKNKKLQIEFQYENDSIINAVNYRFRLTAGIITRFEFFMVE